MVVRTYWPSCDYRQKKWGARPIDAFWVEATREEAVEAVFPMLSPELRTQSERIAGEHARLAGEISRPPRAYCFLVAWDLSSIDPFHVHYPFHQCWNGASPFRAIPERTITSLGELAGLLIDMDS
jgi:hypothetical protein